MALIPKIGVNLLGESENISNSGINFLSPVGFRFQLNRAPNVEYFCQGIALPTISMQEVLQQNPFNVIPRPGDKITYEPLTLRFRIDEQMINYLEIHNWLIELGYPENFDQYKKQSVYSDGSVIVLSSNNNPIIRISFEDMFPLSLSPIEFNTTQAEIEYLEAEISFRYRMFKIESL